MKMPQFKKLAVSPSNILPKANLKLDQAFSIVEEGVYPQSYLTLLLDDDISQASEPESDVSDSVQNRPRKRQRLDHLSQEEKVMRRKMKNRVAAQTARDRKKAKMQELEEQVSRLIAEKRILLLRTAENVKRINTLEQENSKLKSRLGLEEANNISKGQTEEKCLNEPSSVSADCKSLEQASLINGTQLKEQDLQMLSLWMMQYVYLPVIASLMTFWICYSSVGKILWNMTSAERVLKTEKTDNNSHTLQKWWGPHQKAWNPTKN